jgi:hypothetical protein
MLYTIRPLERIYANPDTFSDKKNNKPKAAEEAEAEYKEVLLPSGRIVTRRDGENYVIERINSTDMQDYLNEDYVPGRSMKDRR